MSAERVSLTGIRDLNGLLSRMPTGQAARHLAERLGVWTTPAHDSSSRRTKSFPQSFARLSDSELSDANAYWLSEVFRATELTGLIEGQRSVLSLEGKALRASTRATLRRHHRGEAEAARTKAEKEGLKPVAIKDPTAAQLADEVEENHDVQEHETQLALLALVAESVKAYKEACLVATAGISREISFRQAQMGAKLR